MSPVQSWGRLSAEPHRVVNLRPLQPLAPVVAGGGAAYGMGRSYGDVCLNPGGTLWNTQALNHFLAFDAQTGVLRCEAGTLLRDIQRTFVHQGWMLPVTPGTQFVTVGGAIANDVHGKNHHAMGSFGDHVLGLTLLRTDGTEHALGRHTQPDLFAATVGGLGLTGLITQATLQLRRVQGPWLHTETQAYGNLGEFFALADEAERDWEYTVSWIDCIGGRDPRGIFMRGNHAAVQAPEPRQSPARTVPFTPPISLINPLSLRAFNLAYFHGQRLKQGPHLSHYQPFFYPLDSLLEWNRIYGPRGFFQHQCVLPRAFGRDGIAELLVAIKQSGAGSFLAVLKTFGDRPSPGLLSFPMPGVTLALDFPNHGADTLALLQRLHHIVQACGGRVYAAKDACMPRALFEQSHPQLQAFQGFRDPGISTALSRRLMGS